MAATAPTGTRATFREVFAVGEFRILFGGMLMFTLGFEFEILGLSVLVYARTGSAVWAAAAFSAGFLPQAAGGAFLTSLADRLPPRLVITASLLARALPGLVIGLAPDLPVPASLAVVALAALVTPLYLASNSGLLPEILNGDGYILGRSVFNITASGTQIIGLGAGGAVLAALPARWLLLLAGASLIAAAAITRLGLHPRPARAETAGPGRGQVRGTVRATLAGHAELLASRRVRRLLSAMWLPSWFAIGAEALAVPYTESLGRPASAASVLLAAAPCGMLIGDVIVGRFCRPAVRERLTFPLALLLGLPLLMFALRPPLPLAAALLLLSGAGYAYSLGLQQPFLDALPARLRGQGFGLLATGLMSGQGLLPSAFGSAATVLGPAAAIATAGAAVTLASLTSGWRLRQEWHMRAA